MFRQFRHRQPERRDTIMQTNLSLFPTTLAGGLQQFAKIEGKTDLQQIIDSESALRYNTKIRESVIDGVLVNECHSLFYNNSSFDLKVLCFSQK